MTVNPSTRPQCFFFPRENEKCPRKRILVLFLVFFSGGKWFSRAVWSFRGHIFEFFLGVIFFFLYRPEI